MSILPIALVVMVGALALANVVAYWKARPGKPEEIYHFKCPKCGQRLRYRKSQIGNPGMCRRCKDRWTFPVPKGR